MTNFSLRKFINTYAPLPIKLKRKGILFGKSIHANNSRIWHDERINKVEYYKQLDPVAMVLLEQIKKYVNKDELVLDICCNVGRHLNYLTNEGYCNLHGFDVMKPAIENMPRVFPKINYKNIQLGNAVDIIPAYHDNSFDWAYTHSATIELIHPSFKIHNELSRIVKKGLIFLLNENQQGYVRNYEKLFNSAGFITAKKMLVASSKDYNFTLYVFVRNDFLRYYINPDFLIE